MGIVNMKDTEYYKSGDHKRNADAARELAKKKNMENKKLRIIEYDKNPKLCKECSKPLSYQKRINVFCGSSCSCTYNNRGRIASPESKLKRSKTLKGRTWSEATRAKMKIHHDKKRKKLHVVTCKICGIEFECSRKGVKKTCSKTCHTIASTKNRSYQNGSRKPVKYFNKWHDTEYLLESSWEVEIAKFMDAYDIRWDRPDPMKWVDQNGVDRLYYPDFYIPTLKMYLDPKNPYCMEKDRYKMEYISNQVDIIYGHLNQIKDYVANVAFNVYNVNYAY